MSAEADMKTNESKICMYMCVYVYVYSTAKKNNVPIYRML